MHKYATASFGLLTAACVLAACGGRTGAGPAGAGLTPSLGAQTSIRFTLPKNTIGAELPSEGVGTENDPTWGTVGGYTQSTKAQVLAFPPGTTVTFQNLSGSIPHTLDVVMKVKGPPAHFPPNPTLSIPAKGNGVLAKGYASGAISPGKSVSIKLLNKGNYLIGCAFHYHEGMQDVIRVLPHATPGPHQ
jgi:plastocyanin